MKLQDYIHYYIGCRCVNAWFPEGHEHYDNNWKLTGFLSTSIKPFELENDKENTYTDSIKLLLRKWDSITDDEIKQYINFEKTKEMYANVSWDRVEGVLNVHYSIETDNGYYPQTHTKDFCRFLPEDIMWLTKNGFDVFGLIDAGLAIDSKTLK